MRYMEVLVLRPADDRYNHALCHSDSAKSILVMVSDGQIDEQSRIKHYSEMPVYCLDINRYNGREYRSLKPYEGVGRKHYMASGNFAWDFDSRFRERIGEYPVPIHDRTE